MSLQSEFDAAVRQVNDLSDADAARHMTDLYGLYKQATDGDVNMKHDEVNPDAADLPNGPAGLSQAQWESWDKYKGLPEDEAKRQYVAKVAGITGAADDPVGVDTIPTDALTNAPQPGSVGGLRGDITAGAPYGGEDLLKEAQ